VHTFIHWNSTGTPLLVGWPQLDLNWPVARLHASSFGVRHLLCRCNLSRPRVLICNVYMAELVGWIMLCNTMESFIPTRHLGTWRSQLLCWRWCIISGTIMFFACLKLWQMMTPKRRPPVAGWCSGACVLYQIWNEHVEIIGIHSWFWQRHFKKAGRHSNDGWENIRLFWSWWIVRLPLQWLGGECLIFQSLRILGWSLIDQHVFQKNVAIAIWCFVQNHRRNPTIWIGWNYYVMICMKSLQKSDSSKWSHLALDDRSWSSDHCSLH